MMTEHPAFPNPSIREALCEIHFDLPDDIAWDPALFSKFYRAVEHEFPEMEPVSEPAFQLQLLPGRMELMPSRSRMRYRHASKDLLLQLSQGVLTINVLRKYVGWRKMKASILQARQWADEVFGPIEVNRIGLRYINFIARTQEDERPIEWLSPNDYVARAALLSGPGFLSRVEAHSEAYRRSVVTLGESVEDETRYIVLDIDCIAEREIGTSLPLEETISALHDEMAWSVFESFLTRRYRALLEGGAP